MQVGPITLDCGFIRGWVVAGFFAAGQLKSPARLPNNVFKGGIMKTNIRGTLRSLLTILAFSLLSPLAQGFTIDTSSTSISPMTGLWNNVNEDGWGTMIVQQYDMMFVTMYTYDGSGNPTWYVASACAVVGDHCSGSLYKVTGGSAPTAPWSAPNKAVSTAAANFTITFADVDHGTMSYTLNNVSATKSITRSIFWHATTVPPASTSYAVDIAKASTSTTVSPVSGLWNNTSEDGWGTMIIQQYGMMFVAMYTYDSSGNPIWYVASACAVTGNKCAGSLYKVTGGTAPTVAWNGNNKAVSTAAANFAITFSDADHGTMTYTINNVTATKTFARSVFRNPPAPSSATSQEVRQMVGNTLSVVTGAGGSDVSSLLSDVLAAALSSTPSTCPAVSISPANLDLSAPPPSITVSANYPSAGCVSPSGPSMSGGATLALTNLNMGTSSLSTNFSFTFNNLKRNGVLLGNGQISGSVNNIVLDANSNLQSGTATIQLSNLKLSTGDTFNGSISMTFVSSTVINVSTNLSNADGLIALNLQLTESATAGVSTLKTTSTGTIRNYSTQINNLQLNTNVCKNYPIGGSITFTKASQVSTVTFNGSCDGNYAYTGP